MSLALHYKLLAEMNISSAWTETIKANKKCVYYSFTLK